MCEYWCEYGCDMAAAARSGDPCGDWEGEADRQISAMGISAVCVPSVQFTTAVPVMWSVWATSPGWYAPCQGAYTLSPGDTTPLPDRERWDISADFGE